jgi:hypothetical protein
MSKFLIPFDSKLHHIYIKFEMIDSNGIGRYGLGILDTGAPRTEFADSFLNYLGIYEFQKSNIEIPDGQQTKKFDRIILPSVTICGCRFKDKEFLVSRFEKSWGINALIGLDLFRMARITIDYKNSQIISEPF